MRHELMKDDVYLNQKTLCIDIENIFVRKVNILDAEELSILIEIQKYDYYILVDQNLERHEESEEDSEVNSTVTNKLETNQKLISEIV